MKKIALRAGAEGVNALSSTSLLVLAQDEKPTIQLQSKGYEIFRIGTNE